MKFKKWLKKIPREFNSKGEIILTEIVDDEPQSYYWRFINWYLGCPCCGQGGKVIRTFILLGIFITSVIIYYDFPLPIKVLFGLFDIPLIYLLLKVNV